jgi:hypothetical protein
MATFLFTALRSEVIRKLLRYDCSGLVFNFLLHLRDFVGHRYAMAAPLMTASLFLATASPAVPPLSSPERDRQRSAGERHQGQTLSDARSAAVLP